MIKTKEKKERRKQRTRKKFGKTGYRLVVFRSNKFFYAYLLDQKTGKTIMGSGEKKYLEHEKTGRLTKAQKARLLGLNFTKDILKRTEVKEVVFDRGGYLYHGRVKAFAEGAREGGLKF